MKKTRTLEITKTNFRGYLKTSIEYIEGAKDHFAKERFIACCGDAVHGIIAGSDALTIYFLGRKSAGASHLDAVKLLEQVTPGDEELKKQIVKFKRVLGLKNAAEYEGGMVNKTDAEGALKDAERFLSFVKKRLRQ